MRRSLHIFIANFPAGRLSVAAALTVIFATGISAQVGTHIKISPETSVKSGRIALGDISRVSGESDRSERLRSISLGISPNIGSTRELSREQIVLMIAAAGFAENEITLESPARVLVRRVGQTVSVDQIREAIGSAILGRLAANNIVARLTSVNLPENLQVPVGKVEVRANPADVRDMFTAFSLPVEIFVDGKKVRSFSATVEIEAFAEVYVAAKDLSANTKISSADLRLEKRLLSKPITNYYRDSDQLRGLRLVKNVAGGSELTADQCIPASVVNAGDTVRVEGLSGRVKIILIAEARTSGRIGDRIAVRNIQSGSILQAIVMDEGQVKIIF